MDLTKLEMSLIGGAIATFTAIASTAINRLFTSSSIKDEVNSKVKNLVDLKQCDFRAQRCNDRFDYGDKKMEESAQQILKLSKMFERFIIYSELPSEVKAKIINGDGGTLK